MSKVIRQKTDIGENLKNLIGMQRLETKVGWGKGAKYEDGTPVAYVATIQEFGDASKGISPEEDGDESKGIPPRSFMRTTASEKKNEWAKIGESGVKAVLAGKATPQDVMEGIGLAASGDIRKKISQIQTPPLKTSTINNRLRKLANNKKVGNLTKPLVESAHMINTLTSVTESK